MAVANAWPGHSVAPQFVWRSGLGAVSSEFRRVRTRGGVIEPRAGGPVGYGMGVLPPILIIDDDPDDLFIFRRLLAKAGVQNRIVAFDDATAAMDYLDLESRNSDRRFLPCVVLTDLHMPGVGGLEVTAWIRAHPALSTMAVIVLSSSEAPEDEGRAKAGGATRFLRKYPSSHGLRVLIGGLPCATVT